MNYRIGVATTDGLVVNQHFGRAESFLIVETDESGEIRTIEQRFVQPVCNGGNHDDHALEQEARQLEDCNYILVSRIGPGASAKLQEHGIRAYEIPGVIEESVKKLVGYIQIEALLG